MTTSAKTKRLDEIESQMTPKEWVIRLIDEMRKEGTGQSAAIKSFEELLKRAMSAIAKQAETKYPGKASEDIRGRTDLRRSLQIEFHALKKLIGQVNEKITDRAETAGLEAALKISSLQTIILQDAFGRTARKAAGWIKVYETEGKDEEENRQIMLDELRAYMDVDFGEKATDSIPLLDIRIRFPSIIETWIKAATRLIEDAYRFQAAVQIIQDKYFDGHPVLSLDSESRLKKMVMAVEDAAGTFNDYLEVRANIFKADWEDEEENEGGFVTAIPGEREGTLKIDLDRIKAAAGRGAKDLAKEWAAAARDEAVFDIRQAAGEGEAAFEDLAISRGWIKP